MSTPVIAPSRPRFWTRPWFALLAMIIGFAAGLALALWI
jgi:hypothetical protein